MRKNPTDDELLRSYLLDELSEEEADRLERKLLEDDDLFELGEAMEADLLAAYARGELAADKEFRRLTASPGGRERFVLARSLDTVAQPVPPVIPFRRRTMPSPVIRWATLAAALLTVIGILGYVLTARESAPQSQIAEISDPTDLMGSDVSETSDLVVTTDTTTEETDQNDQRNEIIAERPPEPVKATFTLSLMTLRSAPPKIEFSLPADADLAVIEVYLDEGQEQRGPFHTAVRVVGKGVVWEKDRLKPKRLEGSPALVLEIPAELLPEGYYEVAVTAGTEEVTKDFKVVRENR